MGHDEFIKEDVPEEELDSVEDRLGSLIMVLISAMLSLCNGYAPHSCSSFLVFGVQTNRRRSPALVTTKTDMTKSKKKNIL